MQWYRQAAESGNANAQYALGVMYDRGQGLPQDYVEAAKWYLLAAEQGDARAQNDIAVLYAEGLGVPRSDIRAYQWLTLAIASLTSSGDPKHRELAISNCHEVASRMTEEQLSEVRRLALTWKREGAKRSAARREFPVVQSQLRPQNLRRRSTNDGHSI